MTSFDVFLLSISLAMDCFAVSIASGAILQRWRMGTILRMAVLFGLFQALMPLLGWLTMQLLHLPLSDYGRWVGAALLLFVAGRMGLPALRGDDEAPAAFRPERLATQLLLAVATSIDALAVGVTFSAFGYTSLSSLLMPLLAIGMASLLLTIVGHWLGIRFGRSISRRLRPELLGAIVLTAIAVKVLVV